MQDRFSTYLKTIALERFGDVPKNFFSPLSDVLEKAISEATPLNATIQDLSIDPLSFIQGVDYTWLLPIFNKCGEEEKYMYFSLLPPSHQVALLKEWKVKVNPIDLSSMAKSFFYPKFFEKWSSFPMVSKQNLPINPLTPLVGFSKGHLAKIIDYLGLYDLSRELYPIVDGSLLRKVLHSFSEPKQEFIKRTMKNRPKILASPFGIKKWDGDSDRLKSFTHFRGLVWFSSALSLEGEDFWWYLTHRLDIGRAHVMVKARKKRSEMEVKKLAAPVLNLMIKLKQ